MNGHAGQKTLKRVLNVRAVSGTDDLSDSEKETIICWNSSAEAVSIYTSQPETWRKLEKIEGFKLVDVGTLKDGGVYSKEYECPKGFVRFTSRGITIVAPRKTTEAQKEAGKQLTQARLRSKPNVESVESDTLDGSDG